MIGPFVRVQLAGRTCGCAVARSATVLALLAAAACATAREKGGLLEPVAPAGLTDQAPAATRHALLVGIDQFEDKRLSPLKFASKDAQAMAQGLSEFDDVVTLTSPEQTTRAAVLEALSALENRIRSPQDTVVLYFSTHGSLAQEPGGELKRQLVMRDSRLDLLGETGLSMEALARRAAALKARRVLLVLATCHSGRGKSQLPDALAQALARRKAPAPPPLEEVSEAVIVVTAASFSEAATEEEALGHDVYTHFLLDALSKGDRDGDGAVTASEAHDYARERTYAHTAGRQRPTAESSVLGVDPIVLRGKPGRSRKPVLYSYARSSEGLAVVVDGARKGVLPGGVALESGQHELALTEVGSGRAVYSGSIELADGEARDLAELVPRPAQLSGALSLGAFLPVTSAAREQLGAIGQLSGQVSLTGWPKRRLTLGLRLSFLGGGGALPGSNESLPFTLVGSQALLAGGWAFEPHRAVSLTPGLGLGAIWLFRSVRAPSFRSDESLLAGLASALLEARWHALAPFELGARAELAGFPGRMGLSFGPHLATSLGLFAEYRD